jgi:ferredoxin
VALVNEVLTADEAIEARPVNLLDYKPIKAFLKSPLYPAVFAYPVLLVFAYIIYALLWGPGAASANLGTSLTWVLWWPLLPLAMFLMGRFWCAICPFGTVIDLVQRFAGLGKPVAPFLKKYGIWIIDATFIFITWSDHVFGVVESPRGSGYLLGAITVASVVTAVIYDRRVWCRYLCFLGGLNGNYARASMLELRATPDICATCKTQNCFKGNGTTPGCPVFEFPRVMATNANCNLCANCIKTCPNDSIRITPRAATRELWFIKRPKFEESFLAAVIVGIVLVQNVTMVSWWGPFMERLTAFAFGSEAAAFTLVFLVAMALPLVILAGASKLSGGKSESWKKNFARFGYAIIPLDLAAHLAHNLFHLLAEGKNVLFNLSSTLGGTLTGSPAFIANDTIQLLQFLVVALGVAGSAYAAWQIAERQEGNVSALRASAPHLVAIVLFGLVNLYLFTLPMMHRV